MSRKLYVGNLSYNTTEGELETLFSQSGTVESVRVMRDMATGRARGFGFVEMATDEEAQAATRRQRAEFGGRALTVNEARLQEACWAASAAIVVAVDSWWLRWWRGVAAPSSGNRRWKLELRSEKSRRRACDPTSEDD